MNIGRIATVNAFRDPDRESLIEMPVRRARTFGQLEERTSRLANALGDRLGLQKGDRVAVLSRNRIEYFEVYLACARAGFVTLALNWRLAVAEQARILEDAAPRVLVADTEFTAQLRDLTNCVEVPATITWGGRGGSEFEELVASGEHGDRSAWAEVGDDDHLLVMYTGGSTGTSKGVLHSHRSAFAAMVNNTVAERVVPSDKYILLGQAFHSAAVLAMNYLMHGCPVVLVNFEPKLALDAIEAERCTATLGFTSMVHYMLEDAAGGEHDLSSLRNMQYGGGPMPVNVIQEMLRAFPCTLIQCYGTTESVGVSFLNQEDHLDAARGIHPERLASCGREAFLTEVRLLDAEGTFIPPDSQTPGEIVVRSDSNMLGYWNRDDLNAESWHGPWLRTGDIARWGEDRYLYVVDRAKDVIISGGENIYSSQVENAIHTHPSVLEVAVVGVPDPVWGESVKAFVVLRPGAHASAEDIAGAVTRELGSYQKPRYVDFLPELPRGAAGKVAKHELRQLTTPVTGAGVNRGQAT